MRTSCQICQNQVMSSQNSGISALVTNVDIELIGVTLFCLLHSNPSQEICIVKVCEVVCVQRQYSSCSNPRNEWVRLWIGGRVIFHPVFEWDIPEVQEEVWRAA